MSRHHSNGDRSPMNGARDEPYYVSDVGTCEGQDQRVIGDARDRMLRIVPASGIGALVRDGAAVAARGAHTVVHSAL